MTDQPFRVEYARSNRSKCKPCGGYIEAKRLRLGEDIQSPFYDGLMTKWYHPDCFFLTQAPKLTSIAEIKCFDSINSKDQELVREKIEQIRSIDVPSTSHEGVEESIHDDETFIYPECLLKNIHIHEQDGKRFSIIFNRFITEINRQSYYKIQILKHDIQEKYWLFRSWGRIGTSNGDNSLKVQQLDNCLKNFENCVKCKLKLGYHAVEHPDSLYPIEINEIKHYFVPANQEPKIRSELKKPVQELIRLIFDLEKDKPLSTQNDNISSYLDSSYKLLNTKIEWIKKKSKEFQLIKKYLQNTHANQHSLYTLEIEDAFKVKRPVDDIQYQPYKLSSNKKLLWYGAPVTDYISILTQGLTYSVPETPATDYMFGEGIYFTDVVSKAADRCFTDRQDPTGLLLLCEVALGNMHVLKKPENIKKLPNRKHSIFGQGKFHPDPKKFQEFGEIQVPSGPIIPVNGTTNSKLLFNDYTVRDPDRVKIRYIVRVKFNY